MKTMYSNLSRTQKTLVFIFGVLLILFTIIASFIDAVHIGVTHH